jgi:hypothetical protein
MTDGLLALRGKNQIEYKGPDSYQGALRINAHDIVAHPPYQIMLVVC